jgi:uncharacterized protein
MPKKSSKKGSKQAAPAAETTLVPHRTPHLTELLERAKEGKLSDVQQYLRAGGSPHVLVEVFMQQTSSATLRSEEHFQAPLALLQAGAAVDAISTEATGERTALMLASSLSNNLSCVEALLQGGADPCYQASGDGMSALHLAAAAGFLDVCKVLHTASASALELRGKEEGLRATPLIAACVKEQFASMKLLCTLGADVNRCSVSGRTPLMVAAGSKKLNTSILQFLLRQDGIQVNYRSDSGDTALMIAADVGNAAAVRLLLDHGADTCILNKQGFSVVFPAVAVGHLHVPQLLIQHGADITATANGVYTLLMQAAKSNQPRIAEFLINKGLSVHAVDELGNTALHHAAYSTRSGTETMRVLLVHGTEVNACDLQLRTSLHLAASRGQLDKLEVLIAAGADVAHGDFTGRTVLHEAIHCAHPTAVKLLLEHGVDAVLNTMQCKICYCCEKLSAVMMCRDTATLKLLLTAGADVHAVTTTGDTCLHIAARHKHSAPVVCLLIKAGVNMHVVNSAGKTAAQAACDRGNKLLEQLLNRAAQQA